MRTRERERQSKKEINEGDRKKISDIERVCERQKEVGREEGSSTGMKSGRERVSEREGKNERGKD